MADISTKEAAEIVKDTTAPELNLEMAENELSTAENELSTAEQELSTTEQEISTTEQDLSTASLASSFVPVEPHLEAIQLIDENKQFNQNVLDYISNEEMPLKRASEHRIVAVFGSQSTGKSTLLNHLFNTNFGVMNEASRQQTTKGIWLAVSPGVSTTTGGNTGPKEDKIVVMDVEGTDGTERGEDQDFERKAALFALATSEVLIVNLWETQVGWYQGANMGLMKTVFEVNLSLFGRAKLDASNDHKVLLLFVIRDHTGVTSKESLSSTLNRDLLRIWESLNKPVELADLAFSDFFDVEYHTLSHKIYQNEKFLHDVKLLGDRFVDQNGPDFLFKPNYCHDIPIEGWTMYAESCWDQIDSNKDLDLPTQQIMVARCKCEELAALCFEDSEARFDELHEEASANIQNDKLADINYAEIAGVLDKCRLDALTEYDSVASKYNTEVYEQRRTILSEKILTKLFSVVQIYGELLNNRTLEEYGALLNKRGKSTSLIDAIKSAKSTVLSAYALKLSLLSLDGAISTSSFSERLEGDIIKLESEEKISEVNSITKKLIKKLSTVLNTTIQSEVNKASDQTWDNIKKQFETLKKAVLNKYESGDSHDFGLGEEPLLTEATLATFEFKSWLALQDAIAKFTTQQNLFNILKEKFDEKFGYDINGNPRVYQNTKELETAFIASKNAAVDVLPNLAVARLSDGTELQPTVDLWSTSALKKYENVATAVKRGDFIEEGEDEDSDSDDENSQRNFAAVVSESSQEEILRKFKRETDAIFVACKGAIVQSRTQIPYYIYLVILVLGWNEFLAVIRNPFFFSLLLVLGAAVYGMYQTNLLGPAMTVGQRVLEQTIAMAKEKLREFVVDDHEFHARNLRKVSEDKDIELDDLRKAKDD